MSVWIEAEKEKPIAYATVLVIDKRGAYILAWLFPHGEDGVWLTTADNREIVSGVTYWMYVPKHPDHEPEAIRRASVKR